VRARSSTRAVVVAISLAATHTLAPNVGTAQNLPDLFRRTSPSVVLVVTYDAGDKPTGFGSGVILSRDGLVATNEHVIRNADRILLKLVSGRIVPAVDLVQDAERDLAILWTPEPSLSAAKLGDSDQLRVGESVLAIGNPQGLEHTLSAGIVSGIRRVKGYQYIQTTVPISPGSSGGPIVNMNGEVVGLAMGVLSDAQNLNFALPSNDIHAALSRARTALRILQTEVAQHKAREEAAKRRAEESEKRRQAALEAERRAAEEVVKRTAQEEAARRQAAAAAAKKVAEEEERRERQARRAAEHEERRQAAASRIEAVPADPSESPFTGRRFSLLTPKLEVPPPASPQPSIDNYKEEVKRRIYEKWVYPQEALWKKEFGHGEVRFVIRLDGTVKSVEILQSTGVLVLDRYFDNAIRLASPFPPLPEVQREELVITLTFQYVLGGPKDGNRSLQK
jgi:TonB family protein